MVVEKKSMNVASFEGTNASSSDASSNMMNEITDIHAVEKDQEKPQVANVPNESNDQTIECKAHTGNNVPSLVDASDCEESSSDTSRNSSPMKSAGNVMHMKSDATQGSRIRDAEYAQIDTLINDMINTTKQNIHEEDAILIDLMSTEQAMNKSTHTPETSNEILECSCNNDENIDASQETFYDCREDDEIITRDDINFRHKCGSIFENSIQFITDFFTCSSPYVNMTCCACFGSENLCKENRGCSDTQLQKLQSCIEIDILHLIGCSSEGAQYWIDNLEQCNLGQSLLCYRCQWSEEYACNDSRHYPNSSIEVAIVEKPKVRNRNVYVRQKAIDRIHRLRKSGLSRDFTLSPLHTFLEEEQNHLRGAVPNTLLSRAPDNLMKSQRKGKRSLMPLSKRPKSLNNNTRQTSLGVDSTIPCESVILATRSESIDDEETPSGKSILNSFFQKAKTQHKLHKISDEEDSDLYYDSDPGTSLNYRKMDQSALRKSAAITTNNGRSQTISAAITSSNGRSQTIGELKSTQTIGKLNSTLEELIRVQSKFLEKETSVIQSLDINSFDINDNEKIAEVVRELVTTNFSFIWHSDKSGSFNAMPQRVKAWFETGSCLKSTLLQPKFVWRSNDNATFSSRQSKMKSIQRPKYIELLNIVRIVAPSQIDKETYPFVKKDCAFIVVTNTEEETLFETATRDERDNFLFSFKLMVARLASKIIVGDKDVFDEFFAPPDLVKKTRKKRRKKTRSRVKAKYDSDAEREGAEVDFAPVMSGQRGFSNAIIGTVEEESRRKDELWGINE